jgi:CHASE2 domain-containing sensor protein
MRSRIRHSACIIVISLFFAVTFYYLLRPLPYVITLHRKSYDILFKIEYKLHPPPSAINDILLVDIDNHTLENMPQRWPYSRATYATAIENLKKAGARVIAFDFIFWGKTNPEDDASLAQAVEEGKVIFPCLLNGRGIIECSNLPGVSSLLYSGIVTKIQDRDGVTRKNFVYLVDEKDPQKGMLSWGLQVLKAIKSIDLSTLAINGNIISFQNNTGEKWVIPVYPMTKTFPIHFHAHAVDFNRISFLDIVKGDFDPDQVRDKIVLVGTLSSLLGDTHLTPIGWLPGIALNANVVLALYTHDFLKDLAAPIELCVIIIGIFISGLLVAWHKTRKAILLISLEVFFILIMTYILFIYSYFWNYPLMLGLIIVCPFAAKRIYLMFLATQYKKMTGLMN